MERYAFRRYVAQDVFFLRAFLKAYALGAAKCDDFDRARVFHDLMTGVLDELKLHESYSATLGIDLDNVEPYAAIKAYTDFLLRVSWHGSLAEMIAAMVPCMRLYQHLGHELASALNQPNPIAVDDVTSPLGEAIIGERAASSTTTGPNSDVDQSTRSLRPDHPYEQWIKTYAGDEFGKLCAQLELLLNEITSNNVLVKGGQLDSDAVDVLWTEGQTHTLPARRVETHDTHGTGCVLSAAITARLAKGEDLVAAVNAAKQFITAAIRTNPGLGSGFGPVNLHSSTDF